MHKQAYNPPPNTGGSDENSPLGEVERLTAELSKWQGRVPKLSAALRERTERVKSLEHQLQKLREHDQVDSGSQSEAGIKARGELIGELEVKIKELNGLHQTAQGQLHSSCLEVDELHAEVKSWKDQWQLLTQSLDDQAEIVTEQKNELKARIAEVASLESKLAEHADELSDKTHQIQLLHDETDSLGQRNENLFETTELANRQIETLGDNLGALRIELREKDEAGVAKASEFDTVRNNLETITQKSAAKDDDIDALLGRVETKQKEIDVLIDQLVDHDAVLAEQDRLQQRLDRQHENLEQQLTNIDSLTQTVAELQEFEQKCSQLENRVEALREESNGLADTITERDSRIESLLRDRADGSEEVTRLEGSVAAAEEVTATHDKQRGELSEQIADTEERVHQLEAQLAERSNLVVSLEKENLAVQESCRSQEKDTEELSDALAKAERHAEEYGDHISQLDDKLHRQQELMLNLEGELAEAQQSTVSREQELAKALSEKDEQIKVLTEEMEVRNQGEALVEEQIEELKHSQDSALVESEMLISTAHTEIENLTTNVREQEVALEKLQTSLAAAQERHAVELEQLQTSTNATREQHTDELEKLQDNLKSAESTRESSSDDADRFEEALAQALAARKEMEKDRDDFAGQVDMLESELRDQKRATAKVKQTWKAADKVVGKRDVTEVDPKKIDSQKLEVQKLEQMVRDRTKQLNELQWRQDMEEKNVESSPIDNKMMLVLNQQLADARASNQQLIEQIRELEGGKSKKGATGDDDLTRIRGLGPKLAHELNKLGIFRYEQIANLDEDALSSTSHVLYSHKGRILRDGWIQQAAELAS